MDWNNRTEAYNKDGDDEENQKGVSQDMPQEQLALLNAVVLGICWYYVSEVPYSFVRPPCLNVC